MRRIALVAVAVTAVAGVAAYMGSASGQADGDAAQSSNAPIGSIGGKHDARGKHFCTVP
jgi:hypothetical protein